eukprot:g76402.t1
MAKIDGCAVQYVFPMVFYVSICNSYRSSRSSVFSSLECLDQCYSIECGQEKFATIGTRLGTNKKAS